jgi:hypothetical protein
MGRLDWNECNDAMKVARVGGAILGMVFVVMLVRNYCRPTPKSSSKERATPIVRKISGLDEAIGCGLDPGEIVNFSNDGRRVSLPYLGNGNFSGPKDRHMTLEQIREQGYRMVSFDNE